MTRKEFICICKVVISIKIFLKDLQRPSFMIKNSSEALRFTPGRGGSSALIRWVLDLPACSGVEKAKKYTLFWNQEH